MFIHNSVFYILAIVMIVFAILAVSTKRILRAATYLLFVLFATAGLYFMLNYSFLGAVQLTVYAGGIIVLYVFSILLTNTKEEAVKPLQSPRHWLGFLSAIAGTLMCIYLFMHHSWGKFHQVGKEIDMHDIGTSLMSSEKYGYILPFELLSILLLACIVGGILIARKRK